jgi:transcriptional regulator with XRE-family HTH domain
MTTIQPGRLDMERKTRTKAPDARDVDVGRRIRAQRLVCRMSQTELANSLGVTFQQVQKYEKGVNRVGAGRLAKIAEVLTVPVAFFFSGDQTPSEGTDNVNSGLSFLETAGAVRLVRAYSQIEDPQIRRALVDLAEEIAGGRRRDGGKHPGFTGYEDGTGKRGRKLTRKAGRLS